MLPVPAEEPVVSPILTAGLLLAAIPSLTALGLARPSAAEVLDATGASKTRAYEIRAEILTILPSLLRSPGRPPGAEIPATDTGVISRDILAFLMGHPGAAVKAASRHTYSDGFRHRVMELAEQHIEVGIAQLAEAVGVPVATVQDWLLAVSAPARCARSGPRTTRNPPKPGSPPSWPRGGAGLAGSPRSASSSARYHYNAVVAGIATFEGKRDAGTLPPDVGPRYLLGIVRHISERDEGLAIAEHLWRLRLATQDAALIHLDDARRAVVGTPQEQLRSFVDRALADDGPLVRSFWLAATAELFNATPRSQRHALFVTATQRIEATFRVERLDRQAAVRFLAEHVLQVA